MLDPVKMVYVNVFFSILLLVSALIYAKIYPKKKINFFVLLLLIGLLPCISILRFGDYESGDFNIHIYRIIAFFNVLKEGILIPSWAADLNASYGNPLFLLNYSFPYYVISFFHFVGIDFINATKLYLGMTLYFSGITMFFCTKEITGNKLAAFTASIFYLFNPYHLIDVHFRATLGESTIFLIAPLLFLVVTKYIKSGEYYWLIINSLVTGILVMAHPLLAICFCFLVAAYSLVISRKKNLRFILTIISLLIGGIMSSYVWVSFIIYAPFMYGSNLPNILTEKSFYNTSYLFYSPWKLGFLFQGPKGELAQIIGYTQLFVVGLLIILYLKNKIHSTLKISISFWLSIFFLALLLMLPISIVFWNYFKLFWMLIPFGRLSLILAFCTSMLAGYLAIIFSDTRTRKKIVFILIILTIGYTISNWGHRRVIPEITDKELMNNVGKSTVTEGLTAGFLNNKWADPQNFWFADPPKNHLEIIEGKGLVKEIKRTSVKHTYIVNAQTNLIVRENTLYYPGWNMRANNKSISIYPGARGVIYSNLPQGKYSVELKYEDIPTYKFFKNLGVFTFLLLIAILPICLIAYKRNLRRLNSKP